MKLTGADVLDVYPCPLGFPASFSLSLLRWNLSLTCLLFVRMVHLVFAPGLYGAGKAVYLCLLIAP